MSIANISFEYKFFLCKNLYKKVLELKTIDGPRSVGNLIHVLVCFHVGYSAVPFNAWCTCCFLWVQIFVNICVKRILMTH